MTFILVIAAVLTAASIVLTLLLRLAMRLFHRAPRRFWRRALVVHLLLVPAFVFLVAPVALGLFFIGRIGTRPDERAYAGPKIAADGTWLLQSRESLRADGAGGTPDPAASAGVSAILPIHLTAADGVRLRAFLVPPREGPPRLTVILVHGLFRGGLELEQPASMFRDLGAETLLLEMRNHGGSGRAAATFGRDEKQDVLAAAAWLRTDPARAGRPLALFAVSLGTVAVLRAAPEIPDLAGLVLDAPVEDLLGTAHRMLAEGGRSGRLGPAMWRPIRSVLLATVEWRSGFRFSEITPLADAARLPPHLPALVIGGGADTRVPPASVQAVFDRIPSPPSQKTLWIRAGSDHGQVWSDDPGGYRSRLEAFLRVILP